MNHFNLFGSIAGFSVLLWIFSLVKQDRIMLKFALPWISLSLFSIAFSVNINFTLWITRLAGFENPSNLFLTVTVCALVALGILLSAEVTKSVSRHERAASVIAIIESKSSKERGGSPE